MTTWPETGQEKITPALSKIRNHFPFQSSPSKTTKTEEEAPLSLTYNIPIPLKWIEIQTGSWNSNNTFISKPTSVSLIFLSHSLIFTELRFGFFKLFCQTWLFLTEFLLTQLFPKQSDFGSKTQPKAERWTQKECDCASVPGAVHSRVVLQHKYFC